MSLYQELKKHFTLPTAYEDWKDYRTTLTDYLITEVQEIDLPLSFHAGMSASDLLPRLAILGGGACNDIDLFALAPHFSDITILDQDEPAMRQALRQYHLEAAPHIHCEPLSFTGITEADYASFCDALQQYVRCTASFKPEDFEAYSIHCLSALFEKKRQKEPPVLPASYDIIWCFGLHSQLLSFFSYCYHAFCVNLNHNLFRHDAVCIREDAFQDSLCAVNAVLIPQINDRILHACRSAVYIGNELHTLRRNAANEYTEIPGAVEGALQCIEDLRLRELPCEEHGILWPFLPAADLHYEMLIQKISL